MTTSPSPLEDPMFGVTAAPCSRSAPPSTPRLPRSRWLPGAEAFGVAAELGGDAVAEVEAAGTGGLSAVNWRAAGAAAAAGGALTCGALGACVGRVLLDRPTPGKLGKDDCAGGAA